MKKSLKDFRNRELKNLDKIKGGGDHTASVIDRDKVRRPKPGSH